MSKKREIISEELTVKVARQHLFYMYDILGDEKMDKIISEVRTDRAYALIESKNILSEGDR